MSFVIGAGLLSLLAVGVLVWGMRFRSEGESGTDTELTRALFVEKLDQLQQQLDVGDIEQGEYDTLKLEYERQLLIDADQIVSQREGGKPGRWLPIALALMVPVAALLLYSQLGAYDEVALRKTLEQRSALFRAESLDQARLSVLNDKVTRQLGGLARKQPDEPLYPVLMAQLYADQGEFDLAVGAYRRAVALLPENADIRAEYAQALFFATNSQVTDEMIREAELALKLMPNNKTALGLMGIANFHRRQFGEAIGYWQRAIAMLPPGSPTRQSLEAGIAAAREQLGESPPSSQDAAVEKSVRVAVTASPDISLPPDTTVFVYARKWQGSPMPLAIQRLTLADLPATVELNDAMAMNPAVTLSSADKVELVARVSVSGTPSPAAGDWQASSGAVVLGDTPSQIELLIDQQVQ